MSRLPATVIFGLGLALAACSSEPTRWQRPAVKMPIGWQSASTGSIENPQAWWRNFKDPELDALVDRALKVNNDFAVAVIRVRRAQLQAALTGTNRAPSLSAGANLAYTRTYDPQSTLRAGGVDTAVSYEMDLWGRLARQRDASRWEADAAAADCRAFAAALAGTTAKLYWQLAYLNQLLAMAEADIDYARRTLELTRTKYEAGATSGLNTSEAALNLSTLESTRTLELQQRAETRNALAILFDQPPSTAGVERPSLAAGPLPPIDAGLPVQMLANRPDLEAAELRLREAAAIVDATRASFYPSLSLTGSLGTASTSLVDLMRSPIATLGVGLVLPFVQWHTARLSTQISETKYQEAVAAFRQSLYTALAEVESALSARSTLQTDETTQDEAVAQARHAESIARIRFQSGASDVQLWLDAQQRVRGVERAQLANRLSQFNNQADLYRALGLGIASDRIRCSNG